MSTALFPFSAVVGQSDAKLALLLAAVQPGLGGVLLRGDKGSAKTTLARALAKLLPGDAPFVELPLGATEDRTLGSVELSSLLSGTPKVRLGLLASAHGGVLYVDEINLLADHLVDVLLDVAASGVNRIERDGISHSHPARFILIGSMNPEEGELRPQLLDRFGFAVDVRAEQDPAQRREVVQRRLAFEADDGSMAEFEALDRALAERVALLRTSAEAPGQRPLNTQLIDVACRLAIAVGAEGLRADLMLCRGALAHAAFHGRAQAGVEDVQAVAAFVLGHRRRRSPLEPPGISSNELDRAFQHSLPPPAPEPEPEPEPGETERERTGSGSGSGSGSGGERVDGVGAPIVPPHLRPEAARSEQRGKRGVSSASTGRFVRATPIGERTPTDASLASVATLQTVSVRRALEPGAGIQSADLRVAVRAQKQGSLIILCVDASGSMGAEQRMSLTKAAVLGLLTDAYQRRDRVAMVTFARERAELVLRPTASIEIAQARLRELPTGGASPIAAGLDVAYQLAQGAGAPAELAPLLVLITDGRATGAPDALEQSLRSARRFAERRIPSIVIDAEVAPVRLGLSQGLAEALAAPCLSLDALADGSLERTIRLHAR